MAEVQQIYFDPIILHWTDWYTFNDILNFNPRIPESRGVYEVIEPNIDCRLTIGKSINLNKRIRSNLIKGKAHSAGEDIFLAFEPHIHATLLVRWALTSQPLAVEEELHRLHCITHNCMPRFTDR